MVTGGPGLNFMTYTLMRIVDASTRWNPAFALRGDDGTIVTGETLHGAHWFKVHTLLFDIQRREPDCRIVWEGSIY